MIWGYHYFWKHPAVCKLLVLFAFAAFGKYVIFLLTSSSRVSKSVSFSLLQHEAIATEKFERFPMMFYPTSSLNRGIPKKKSFHLMADGLMAGASTPCKEVWSSALQGQETAVQGELKLPTLPETNSEFTPENGWLEYDRFLLLWPIFRGVCC